MNKVLKMYIKATNFISGKAHDESGNWVGTLAGILITVLVAGLVWTFISSSWKGSWSGMLGEKIESLFNLS